jgi:hypothetical protein
MTYGAWSDTARAAFWGVLAYYLVAAVVCRCRLPRRPPADGSLELQFAYRDRRYALAMQWAFYPVLVVAVPGTVVLVCAAAVCLYAGWLAVWLVSLGVVPPSWEPSRMALVARRLEELEHGRHHRRGQEVAGGPAGGDAAL